MQNSLPLEPSTPTLPLQLFWPLNLSLVPEARGKFSLIPELPLAPQKVAVKLDREHKIPFKSLQFPQVP